MHTETTLRLLLSFLRFLYPQVNNKTKITGRFFRTKKKEKKEAGPMSYCIWIFSEEML